MQEKIFYTVYCRIYSINETFAPPFQVGKIQASVVYSLICGCYIALYQRETPPHKNRPPVKGY